MGEMIVEGNITNIEPSPKNIYKENAVERDTIGEEIVDGSDSSATKRTDKHENGDSSTSTNIDQPDDPSIATSQENVGEQDTIREEIIKGPDSSATQRTESLLQHENGDSSTSTNIDQPDDPTIATSQENAGEQNIIGEDIMERSSAETSDSSATQGTDGFVEQGNDESSTSTDIDQPNDPIIATSQVTENAGELDTIYEEIMEGSHAKTSDSPETQESGNFLEHENGDSPTSSSTISSQLDTTIALQPHKRTFSDVPTTFQLETAISQSNSHKRTLSFDHVIDTAAPIESVKEAVSKFGGIVDWKAHKTVTEEKRKILESELEKTQGEIFKHKKQTEEAKDENNKTLSELDSTKKLIAELKLKFERAQTDEQQSKQESELAKLKVKEVQQEIFDDARIASLAELEVAQTRHAAAVAELKSVKDELEKLRGEYSSLTAEKDLAVKRAEEVLSASIEAEKTVEVLNLELTTAKQSLESAHASHLEAEEQRLKSEIAKEQDHSEFEKELRQAEEELEKLKQENQSKQEIKLKIEDATTLLANLTAELTTYEEGDPNKEKSTSELEDIKSQIEKATTEVNYLKVALASLQSELEQEKTAVSTIKNREGMAAITVASLETEIKTINSELELILMEKEGKEKNIAEVPNQLDQATEQKDQCKSLALSAHMEMSKAKEDKELVKTSASTIDRRLCAVQKEIEASRTSEKFALAAATALEKTELVNEAKGVTLSLEEYQALSKKAYDVEEKANSKLAAVIALIEEAMSSELRSLERLEQVNREKAEKKEEYTNAIEAAEKAAKGKLAVEHELRKWRTERRASDVGVVTTNLPRSRTSSIEEIKQRFERSSTAPAQPNAEEFLMETDSSSETEVLKKKKKKRSLFPRIVMFLARRKVQSKIM